MKKPDSYEEVIKELEEIIELEVDIEMEDMYNGDFRFEYAFEAMTERNTLYKRRFSNA